MRRGLALVAAGCLAATMTACSNDDGQPSAQGAAPGASQSASGGAGTSNAPPCVAGSWRATGVSASGAVGGANATVNGGSGATMKVGQDGATEVGFSAAQPLDFTAKVGGATVRGQVHYDGTARGSVDFVPKSDTGGTWNPHGQVSWSDLRGTVRLTEPVAVTLLDNAQLSDLSSEAANRAGGAIDTNPLLRQGTYTCQGDTLKVNTQADGPNLTWTFTRS